MLGAADADLVRRDAAVPGLGTLLDPEAFALALGSLLRDATPGSARMAHLRYKPAWSCLAAYRVDVAGRPLEVYAKALARDAALEYELSVRSPGGPHAHGHGRLRDAERSIVVCVHPDDARLADLHRALHAGSRRRLLEQAVPDHPELWEAEAVPLSYRPERRHVSRLIPGPGEGPGAALKLHARKGFAAASRTARGLESRERLRIAPTLGLSERHRAQVIGWLEGSPLRDVVRGDAPLDGPLGSVGRALAELHAQTPTGLPRCSRQGALATLRSRALALAFLLPSAARLVERSAAAAERRLGGLAEGVGLLHGDFYDKQVVLAGDGVGILDLDQAAAGDSLSDLGLFLAHLELDVVLGHLSEPRAKEAASALLEGYRRERGAPREAEIRVHAAASLLGLASYPFRRRQPEWPTALERLVVRVGELAAGG